MNVHDTDYVLMIARNDRFCHVGTAASLQVHRHQEPPMSELEFFDAAGRRLTPVFDEEPAHAETPDHNHDDRQDGDDAHHDHDHHHGPEGSAASSFEISPDAPVDPEVLRLRIARVLDIARAHVAAHPDEYRGPDGEPLTVPEVQSTLRATMVALARDMDLAGDEPSRHRAGMLHNLMHGIFG